MLDFKSGGSHVSGPPRDTTPVVLAVTQPGIAMIYDDRAILDYSNASEGYICVMSNLPGIRVKVLVDVYASGAQYQYTLDAAGAFVTIPLSEGDGIYSVGVWQNVFDDSYSPVFSYDLNVVLNDQFLPFLYPSQFVDFVYDDAAVNLSQQLAEGSVTDVDAINKIYKWVCQNVKYDIEKATTVASGYLPDNTDTINSGQGICFDYAVLTASMLRAQRVPAKLVIGYAGTTYHAWMLIYSVETGKVVGHSFNGSEWIRMDPTFDAAAGGAVELASVIGDGTNYQPLFYY
jgi:transglutaminase-like putative cysteine protease